MPVSVVCDAASVNAAIRESIGNSSSTSCSGLNDDSQNLQNNLIASTKRVLLSTIEYDELNMFSPLSVFDTTVKSKCISLEPINSGKLNQSSNGDKDSHQNSSLAINAIPGQGNQRDVNQLPPPKKILFPRKSVQIGWKSSNRKWQIGTGMMNVGNTCYLNSTLQALFHVPAMANWLISDSAHREKCEDECGSQGGCIICAMSKTLIASQTSQSPIRPYLIYSKLKMVCKHLVMGRQEDAHEFLRYLVEAMEKSYLTRFRNSKELDQYSKETTPLNQILGGYLKSAVRCLTCGHVSTTYQHFQDILLDIRKANTIEEALDGYFARERLEDMGYKCEACKKKVSATKQFSLERAPISLCIQLKRFSMMGTKLNKHVAFRPHLDLTPYASRKNGEQLKYRLVAMVTHLGASQHCGHYTAIGYTDAGSYYQFDDSCVRPISVQNVLNTNAYIIFYELEDSQQHSRQTSTLVSGSHNEQTKINGQIHYNENNQQRQNPNSCASISNGTAAVSISSKIISKLEISSTTSTIIGPQLPDRTLLKNSHNSNENGCNRSNDGQKVTPNGLGSNNYSKLVNSPSPSKLFKSNNENGGNPGTTLTSNVFSSPKQKENPHLGSKLTIHFKNTNNNSGTANSSNNFNGGNKFQESNGSRYQTPNTTKIQANGCDSSSTIVTQQNKSTLPSMPRLESTAIKEKSLLLQNGLLSPPKSHDNSRGSISNGYSKTDKLTPVKSLVPYESDDESNDSACLNSSKSDNKCENNSSRTNHQSNSLKRNHDSSAESSSMFADLLSGSPKPKQKTPPSPPVIKTKTGFWQVTSADVKPSGSNNATPEKKNPFITATSTTSSISPSKFYSNNSQKVNGKEKNSNGYKWTEGFNNGESKDTVNQLMKFSHRGYGAPVLSWNGHKTDMDREIIEENRLERKRDIRDDEENEMDRGRQKKIKTYTPMVRENQSYNPFQDYQNQYHQNRRWNNNGHSNGGRPFYQNNVQRQSPFHRNQKNFRRHRFHQRSHHQRNGDRGFHHRRDS